MKKIITFLFLLTSLSVPAFSDTGTAAMPFLKLGGGARGAALGGAFSAIADDSTSMFYNPAATVFLDRKEFSFSHTMWLEDMSIENIAYVHPISSLMTIMLGASVLSSGSMDNFDEFGNTGGSFTAMDVAASGGFSYIFTKRLYLGAQLKVFSQSVDAESSMTLGADVGAVLRGDVVRYTFSAMNLGSEMKLGAYSFSLPRTLRGGISRELFRGFKVDGEWILNNPDRIMLEKLNGLYNYDIN